MYDAEDCCHIKNVNEDQGISAIGIQRAMNTNKGSGKADPTSSSSSLSAKALEYYRMYAENDDLPKYFCGSYELTTSSASHKIPSNIPNIPEVIIEDSEVTPCSPTSSVTSTKKLEWDSGADIGYANCDPTKAVQKSTSMPILKQQFQSKEESRTGSDGGMRGKELLMFLRMKVGMPTAESTPYTTELRKSGSDPEMYACQTPQLIGNNKKPHRELNTTIFNYEVASEEIGGGDATNAIFQSTAEDKESNPSSAKSDHSSGKQDKSESNINDTLPEKTKYFKRYRSKKMKSLHISEPVSIECIAVKTDCDAQTQTTQIGAAENTSIAVQTSRRSSKQEILYLFHPSMQCDKTSSTVSSNIIETDQAFSNCNSFEYVSGKENDMENKKATSSTLQSTKDSSASSTQDQENIKKNLQLIHKLIKSKKYSEKDKEMYIRKIAKNIVKSNNETEEQSSESEKIVPQIDRNNKLAPTEWSSSNTNKSISTKIVSSSSSNSKNSKDWKNSRNETQSEKLYSSVESTDSPKETLVNFAKRERENQLVWINNEIDHLVKLKSLLQSKKTSKKQTTHVSVNQIPNYKKSTAVYMITTEKRDNESDPCSGECSSRTKQSADGRIDFHIHNQLGVRDYQFKEIITTITPAHNPTTPSTELKAALNMPHHHFPSNSHQSFVSDHNTSQQCLFNPCSHAFQGGSHYPDPSCPAVPSQFQRDIMPVAVAGNTRSRSTSPKSTSVTDDTSLYPMRRKPTSGRTHGSTVHKKPKERTKAKKDVPVSSGNDSYPLELGKCPDTACSRKPIKPQSEESDLSRYESLSRYQSLSTKGSLRTKLDMSPALLGLSTNYSRQRKLNVEKTQEVQSGNELPITPTKLDHDSPRDSSDRSIPRRRTSNGYKSPSPTFEVAATNNKILSDITQPIAELAGMKGMVDEPTVLKPTTLHSNIPCLRKKSNPHCGTRDACVKGCPAAAHAERASSDKSDPEHAKDPVNGRYHHSKDGINYRSSGEWPLETKEIIREFRESKKSPHKEGKRSGEHRSRHYKGNRTSSQEKSDGGRASYKAYKAQKQREKENGRHKSVPQPGIDIPSVERFTNTESVWIANADGDGEFINRDTTMYPSAMMRSKSTKHQCQCTESTTGTVSLQTIPTVPELIEKGVRTDEQIIHVDGKEIQVTEEKPEMKQMGVGEMITKKDKETGNCSIKCKGLLDKDAGTLGLSLTPAAVVTYTPSSGDNLNAPKKSYKMVKDMSKIDLNSAVVISSVVTTSIANPEDNIRRLVLEMPLEDPKVDCKGNGRDKIEDVESNTEFSSAMNSVCSCSASISSDRLVTSVCSTSEVMCSCCGKCIASSESSLMFGDAAQPGGPFCWPCYHQSTQREWNPQEPFYQQADHMCNCYNKVDENALEKIRDTLRQLAEIDNCQENSISSAKIPSKSERLVCQSCNKKIRRDHKLKKPVAYVLKFEPGEEEEEDEEQHDMKSLQEIRVKVPVQKHKKRRKGSDVETSGGTGTDERTSRRLKDSAHRDSKNLQEYLSANRPDFVKSAEERRRCLIELACMREQRCQKYKHLLALTNGSQSQNIANYPDKKHRLFSTKEMKRITAKNYKKLPEVQQKILDNQNQQNKQINRILANIFNKKLRENVLRGQASLSTSISVINLM